LTLESLDDEETHVAFHQSPLLPEYKSAYSRFFECVKKEFPQAKKVSTNCSSKLPKLQRMIEQFGFEEDESYVLNEEFAAVFDAEDLKDFTGYTKELD